jgi:hypothetical protein
VSHDDRKRAIGKVISVAADRFVVEMHAGTDNFTVVGFDDVHYVARLGSFLMIPAQTEYVVAEVISLERDACAPASRATLTRPAPQILSVVPVGISCARVRNFASAFQSSSLCRRPTLDDELDRSSGLGIDLPGSDSECVPPRQPPSRVAWVSPWSSEETMG